VRGIRRHLTESVRALRAALANPDLRRLQVALASLVVGQWAYTVAVAVYAYEQGGVAAVGLVGLIRMLPSAFAAPLVAYLADRYPRRRVLLVAGIAEGAGVAFTAATVAADAPPFVVYALTAIVQVATTAAVPTRAALLPSLARSPEELTAANVAATTIDSVGSFAGPALGGILLALVGVDAVLVLVTAAFAGAVLLMSRIRVGEQDRRAAGDGEGFLRELLAGARTIVADRDLRLITGLYAAQTLVAGALNVLVVVAALELLDLGDAGVGYLNAAIGLGGLAGSLVALGLVARRRLAGDFAAGMVLWGLPMILVAAWAEPAFALIVLGVLGIGNTLVDVAGVTLLQRAVSDAVLARVFGVLEGLTWGTIALGSILASGLVAWLGTRGAFLAVGAVLPLLTALAWPRLAAIDRRAAAPADAQLELLRRVPMFVPLPPAALETLAAALRPVRFPAGAEIVRAGEPGDSFYVVARGEVEVESRTLGPGESFGEIALLHGSPRTATVRARTDVEGYAVAGAAFVSAVTRHAGSARAADGVIAARLGRLGP
jgi:Cyclic nucleotide-binding domain/Major Facilitator Superfamily